MPAKAKKSGHQAYPAELSLQPLKNCLVNLPSALTAELINANLAAQNVIVELVCLQPSPSTPTKQDVKPSQQSIYLGWTGMQSKKKIGPLLGRDGLQPRRSNTPVKEQDIPVVEIDTTFAKTIGLADNQKVGVLLHPNPPTAHTVSIEPLTPTDWEIIELHASFLEINLLSQIRALPNPAFKSSASLNYHPLTLHLSPTSTASVTVTSLEPVPSNSTPFVKISPDAEVIVAPKSRMNGTTNSGKDSRSVHSADDRSSSNTVKTRNRRVDTPVRQLFFLRGVDRCVADEYFDNSEKLERDNGLKVWISQSLLDTKNMNSVSDVLVSIVHPAGFRVPLDPQTQAKTDASGAQDSIKPAATVVARLCPWEEAPDTRHVVLSSQLCSVLDLPFAIGENIRIEAAPPPVPKAALKMLRVFPFSVPGTHSEGFQFGGKSRTEREEAAQKVLSIYGDNEGGTALLEGPLTDGMLLPATTEAQKSLWAGGILRFDPIPGAHMDKAKSTRGWFDGSERRPTVKSASDTPSQNTSSKLFLEIAGECAKPESAYSIWAIGEPLPAIAPTMVGINSLIANLTSNIAHGSSLLLTGGHGSGKTSLSYLLAHHFHRRLYHATYFPCRSLITNETRVSTIKTHINRLFGLASWYARNGGRSLVILDDLDKLCPAETELEVGNDNVRSRHISELFVSTAKHYCSQSSGVILLATAKSKEDVNNVIIGGHVVRDVVNIPSPDKESRRTVLEAFVFNEDSRNNAGPGGERQDAHRIDEPASDPSAMSKDFQVDPSIDFLDVAGQTDGYMPGDLQLLVSRARSEALIRTVTIGTQSNNTVQLTAADFAAALKGFTPSSLLNVTLQHSSTTFASIGGLRETRQILLETLQYPTLYAPIFARCPLRLRSGLLLYGYPGCGKTLLASAVAGECGLNFISVKGPEILNKYIGASEKSVRDLFERAQAARPCVLFFDEFDSVAPKRGHDSTGVTDRVVNQLLTQMDGAEGLSGVYVLAATSRPDLIDPALLRPGRLDKSLLCDMPDFDDRVDILRALSEKLSVSPSLLIDVESTNGNGSHMSSRQNLLEVARRTEGYSGADLQAVVYNAHLEAIHDVLGDRGKVAMPSKNAAPVDLHNNSWDLTSEFTYFRLGEDAEDEDVPLSAAAKASERAKIGLQLKAYRAAQRSKDTQYFDGEVDSGGSTGGKKGAKGANQEPVIEWQHIERSLAQTRPSISGRERDKLARIYKEFVVGRSGEMPSGQGGNEIGGRTSLM